MKNTTNKEQFLKVHIYTRSVDYGPSGVGWGTGFYEKIDAGQTKKLRYVYKIQGRLTDNTYIRLSFSNAESLVHEENRETKPFYQKQYTMKDLKTSPEHFQIIAASQEQFNDVSKAFALMQKYIRSRDYQKAWDMFSKDYQKGEYQTRGIEHFKRQMEPEHPLDSGFLWEKRDFLKLKPAGAYLDDNRIALIVSKDNEQWTITFAKEDGDYKIDWIAGYKPKIFEIQEQDAKE